MNVNDNARECKTQSQMIINYLKTGKSLTTLEALNMFGCFRLSARIAELKSAGWGITMTKVVMPSGKKIASYSLA